MRRLTEPTVGFNDQTNRPLKCKTKNCRLLKGWCYQRFQETSHITMLKKWQQQNTETWWFLNWGELDWRCPVEPCSRSAVTHQNTLSPQGLTNSTCRADSGNVLNHSSLTSTARLLASSLLLWLCRCITVFLWVLPTPQSVSGTVWNLQQGCVLRHPPACASSCMMRSLVITNTCDCIDIATVLGWPCPASPHTPWRCPWSYYII